MNTGNDINDAGKGHGRGAMTLVELLVAMAISSIVLAVVAILIVFAARSFSALANYQVLDQSSSTAADQMSREIRSATHVVNFTSTGNTRHIVFSNIVAVPSYSIRYEWSASSRELTVRRSFDPEPTVLLTGCDRWDFQFFQRTPLPGPKYGFSTNMVNQTECKLLTMSWKCSRPLLGTKLMNTESVQTAQIVLRNQRTP